MAEVGRRLLRVSGPALQALKPQGAIGPNKGALGQEEEGDFGPRNESLGLSRGGLELTSESLGQEGGGLGQQEGSLWHVRKAMGLEREVVGQEGEAVGKEGVGIGLKREFLGKQEGAQGQQRGSLEKERAAQRESTQGQYVGGLVQSGGALGLQMGSLESALGQEERTQEQGGVMGQELRAKHIHPWSCDPTHPHLRIGPIASYRRSVLPSLWSGLATARVDTVCQNYVWRAHRKPQSALNSAFRDYTVVDRQSLMAPAGMRVLFINDACPTLFTRAYSTTNGAGRNNGFIKAPLFRSQTAYYDILGVTGSATQSQIKTAYYRQSFRYHPDRNSGNDAAAERFSEISEAYLILGSVTLRKKYDRGILSQEDMRTAGKPSGKVEGPAVPKRAQTTTSSRYSPAMPVFDFDEFYRAHYGEQLEREQLMKWKREQLRQRREDLNEKYQLSKLTELTAVLFLCSFLLIYLSFK